jgi:hypothetical protein
MKFVRIIKMAEDEEYDSWQDEAEWGDSSILEIAERYGLDAEKVDLNGNAVVVVDDGEKWICTDPENSAECKKAEEWLDEMYDHELDSFAELPDTSFWDEIPDSPGVYYYHGTSSENLPSILENGLEQRNETRGFTNRGMGASVFTSPEYETAAYYYDEVVSIDVGAMKKDGYMPEATSEDPVDECRKKMLIAYQIGLDEYYCHTDSSDGIAEDTVVFYGAIPPKYIAHVEK